MKFGYQKRSHPMKTKYLLMAGKSFLLVVFFQLCFAASLLANSFFGMLQQLAPSEGEALSVTLEVPMDSLFAKSPNSQTANLFFNDATGLAQRWPLDVEVRGKFRRRTCTLPPLKLNFDKKMLEANGLAKKFDKLKLVTPCFDDEAAQQLILKEYLAYRLLNQLSTASFRVQLLAITYRDTNGNHPNITRYAFVMEDADELAERLGGVKLKTARGLGPEQLDRQAETTQAIFAYFIGNTDWSITSSHNLEMIQLPNGTILPVPYDFDFSAFVNAPYATPSNSVGQYSLQQRVYLGFKADDHFLEPSLANFMQKRKDLLTTVRKFKLLKTSSRFELLAYIEGFYSEIDFIERHRSPGQSLFAALRGEQINIIPPGAPAQYFEVGK